MRINKQDEYGLRILLRIARADEVQGLTIVQLSALEQMSKPYAGKITRILRIAGYIRSTRGQKGGYVLARPAETMFIKDVLIAMGSDLYAPEYCEAMWRMLQQETPDDFVIATGETHTVREFIELSFKICLLKNLSLGLSASYPKIMASTGPLIFKN